MRRLSIYRCFYCGKELSHNKKTHDHLTPRSRNGSNKPHNIVDCCRPCNRLKGCLTLDEFRAVMAFRSGAVKNLDFPFPGEFKKLFAKNLR